MKTKILLSAFALTFLLGACKKENSGPNNGSGSGSSGAPAVTTGTLYFKNTQSDPYTIYLDNVNQGVLAAGATSSAYTVTSGISHAIKAEQYSGWIIYPTVYTGTATLNPGGSVTWEF